MQSTHIATRPTGTSVSPYDPRWDSKSTPSQTLDVLAPARSQATSRSLGTRVPLLLPTRIGPPDASRPCVVTELSPSGCVVRHAGLVPTGGTVRLEILFPRLHRRMLVSARAVRRWGRHQAFEFLRLDDFHRLVLAEMLDQLSLTD